MKSLVVNIELVYESRKPESYGNVRNQYTVNRDLLVALRYCVKSSVLIKNMYIVESFYHVSMFV